MDDSKNQAGNARLLNMPGRRDRMLRTMLLCALTAAIFFLPFYIIDGGFFHYAGDFNSQQISFYRYMNGFIKGAGYPDGMAGAARSTFSWATDLGSGAMNAYSFYLYGSPFFWLSLIFPQNWLPYLMVPLLVLKFAVAGGGAYRYLCRYVRRSDHAVLGACLYAFSGFSIYNVFFNHFIDVVALFPWMLWALDETLYEQEEHYGLFAFWVGVNLLNNYFFFIGQVLFLVIYFICKLTTKDFPMNVRLFVRLAFESLLGAALGFVLLWPAVLSILQNPREGQRQQCSQRLHEARRRTGAEGFPSPLPGLRQRQAHRRAFRDILQADAQCKGQRPADGLRLTPQGQRRRKSHHQALGQIVEGHGQHHPAHPAMLF
jgi:uncharacterized membrane protein YfhO